MDNIYKKTLLFFLLVMCLNSFGQRNCVKILEVNEIKYYYVYKVLDVKINDTITVLSSKLDDEFKKILLVEDNFYMIETRIKSAIKISNDNYIFCKHGVTIIENVAISDINKLPVLILDFKKVKRCCRE